MTVNPKSSLPIYEQIERYIRDEIINQNLKPGAALPSIRSLASDLKISVITTKRAYEDLEKEGLIYSVPGKGFYVDDPNLSYMEEKRTLGIEEKLAGLIGEAQEAGVGEDAFVEMVRLLWG